ncbi:hypothetical protein C9374_008395 [Naegleria lovaniensis]|uniref:Serine incorporator n=1 Tax=Naegleria lovaniensis TaxID=51637 RepID=A0AA88KFF1_NAELO|nr:uncharacterized protein C9374_008395 [Naegleria lovaniensis]KAG2378252.1 hypothetical protein C9374_008395 [Naegleria lovaniensis]
MPSYIDIDTGEESGWRSKLRAITPRRLTLTRIVYAFFLVVGFLVALFLREGLFGFFDNVPFGQDVKNWFLSSVLSRVEGKYAVYRICFGCFCYYLMFAFLASRLFCVGDRIRLYIQNKWFIVKFPLFALFMIIPFFIPDAFFYGFAWFSLVMACIFIVVQLIILIDFSFSSAEWFRSKGDDSSYGFWDYLMIVIAIVFYILAVAFIVVEFVFFGAGADCHLNRFFISFTVVAAVISTIVAMVLKRGIYPTGLIFLYTAFLCWSALTSDPSKACNSLGDFSEQGGTNSSTASSIITIIISVLISVFAIVRSAISTGLSFSSFFTMSKHSDDDHKSTNDDDDDQDENDQDDDAKRAECSELFYAHVVFMFSSCYMSCVLANWDILSMQDEQWYVDHSLAAMWVKIATQWVCMAIFGWALIAPKVLKRYRDFDY